MKNKLTTKKKSFTYSLQSLVVFFWATTTDAPSLLVCSYISRHNLMHNVVPPIRVQFPPSSVHPQLFFPVRTFQGESSALDKSCFQIQVLFDQTKQDNKHYDKWGNAKHQLGSHHWQGIVVFFAQWSKAMTDFSNVWSVVSSQRDNRWDNDTFFWHFRQEL